MIKGKDYFYVVNKEQLIGCCNYFKNKGALGFDLETSGLIPREGHIISYQLGTKEKQFVIHAGSFKHGDLGGIFDILMNPDKLKIGHNLKFDFKWMYQHHGVVLNMIHDTMVIESILNKGRPNHRLGLAKVLPAYCPDAPELDKTTRLEFVGQEQKAHLTDEQQLYAALDVKYMIPMCVGQRQLAKLFNMTDLIQLENDTVIPTAMMEHNGIYIDVDKWLALEADAIIKRTAAKEELDEFFYDYEIPREVEQLGLDLFEDKISIVNYNSPPQLKSALGWILGYPIPNTNIEELKKHKHAAIDALLNYREHNKAVTTYGTKFIEDHVEPTTKRIYSTMNQIRADSGRYASQNPNLQNIKKQQEYRTPFCTCNPLDRSMISADYSGCELRLIAELSGEEAWIECFKKGYDMHSYVACLLFGLDYHEITENNKIKPKYKGFRGKAKAINFGVCYGMGSGRLAANLKISFEEAVALLDSFWKQFPKIKIFLDRMVRHARNKGYAFSPLDKRRRWLVDFNYMIPKQRSHAANISKNQPFQSGNASITKRALCYVQDGFFAHPEWEAKILTTIHDEIITTHLSKYDEEVVKFVNDEMVRAGEYYIKKIPVVVDVALNKFWVH